jgi:hypothetical protein
MPERGNIDIDQIQTAPAKGGLMTSSSLSGIDHSGANLINIWLAAGPDGYVLVADSTVPAGIKWVPLSGGSSAITTHSEVLTDSSGILITINSDTIYVLGVPN